MIEDLTTHGIHPEKRLAQYYVSKIKPKFTDSTQIEESFTALLHVEGVGFELVFGDESFSTRASPSWNISGGVLWIVNFEQIKRVPSLKERINDIVSDVEEEPLQLISRDLLDELKNYVGESLEVWDIKANLESFLDRFVKDKLGVQMETETKQFLINELVYLLLKLKSETP